MKQVCKDFLTEQFGDEDVVKEICAEYVTSIQQKLAELDTAMASKNWTDLDHIAHAIKGNALATGDNEMADTAIQLRLSTKLQDEQNASKLIAQLKEFAKEI